MTTWAEKVEAGAASGERAPMQEIEIWSLRINDIAICAVSAEALTELSLEVKSRAVASTEAKARHVLFLGYSNGCFGYLPPPQAFTEGGMEVVESSWNYNLPSQLTPAWAPIVVDTALKSLCSLFGASPESLAPPSADFIVPVAGAGTVYESDDGQIDGGVRYKELLQVLLDFLASDGGGSLPKDGIEDSATGGASVRANPAAGGAGYSREVLGDLLAGSSSRFRCRPCRL